VKEVVYAVGLNDRSHFSREFKKLTGLTPKEFITQQRINTKNFELPPAANRASK
jgi:AraC-like DNA-binding protein